jgi:hypothetical protein
MTPQGLLLAGVRLRADKARPPGCFSAVRSTSCLRRGALRGYCEELRDDRWYRCPACRPELSQFQAIKRIAVVNSFLAPSSASHRRHEQESTRLCQYRMTAAIETDRRTQVSEDLRHAIQGQGLTVMSKSRRRKRSGWVGSACSGVAVSSSSCFPGTPSPSRD